MALDFSEFQQYWKCRYLVFTLIPLCLIGSSFYLIMHLSFFTFTFPNSSMSIDICSQPSPHRSRFWFCASCLLIRFHEVLAWSIHFHTVFPRFLWSTRSPITWNFNIGSSFLFFPSYNFHSIYCRHHINLPSWCNFFVNNYLW